MAKARVPPRKAMMDTLTRRIRPILINEAFIRFQSAKDWLLDEIAAHPVSVDLESHGPSKLLQGSSTGTLFGFFGFTKGSNPVEELLDYLDNNIKYVASNVPRRRMLASVTVFAPSKDEMSKSLKLPWTSTAWPVLIEDSTVPNLRHYINKPSGNSVSGEGIQVGNTVRSGVYTPPAGGYLTPLFADFRKKLLLG